jgi:hypothetical protein
MCIWFECRRFFVSRMSQTEKHFGRIANRTVILFHSRPEFMCNKSFVVIIFRLSFCHSGGLCKYHIYLVFVKCQHTSYAFGHWPAQNFFYCLLKPVSYFSAIILSLWMTNKDRVLLSFFPSTSKHWPQPHLVWHNQRYLRACPLAHYSIWKGRLLFNIVLLGTSYGFVSSKSLSIRVAPKPSR